jgi:hypothetical protein
MQIAINIVNVLQYLERGFITLYMYTNVLITRDINSAINMMMTKYQNNQLGIWYDTRLGLTSEKSDIGTESLKIPKGYIEAVNRRWKCIAMSKRKRKGDKQTMIYKTLQKTKYCATWIPHEKETGLNTSAQKCQLDNTRTICETVLWFQFSHCELFIYM